MTTMECVRFFLPDKRLCAGYPSKAAAAVVQALTKSLGVKPDDIHKAESRLCAEGGYDEGRYIVCRLDQFARFIIERDKAGGQNWVHELRAQVVDYKDVRLASDDPISVLSELTGVDQEDVLSVVHAVGISPKSLWRKCFKGSSAASIDATGYAR